MATQGLRQFGNMRGQALRNVGDPKEGTDALTWALPSYTTTERNNLEAVAGMIIFNTTTNKLNFYNGSAWAAITSV